MKKLSPWQSDLLLLALLGLFVAWILRQEYNPWSIPWFKNYYTDVQQFYAENKLLTVLLFSLAHITSSAIGIPGSCTLLNVSSGALFGFWLGCAIVYPITLFSASLVYYVGLQYSNLSFLRKYKKQGEQLRKYVQEKDYLFLVSLRLNPFFPYGVLNFILGALKVPFGLYFVTTLVGVFFDVTLLNNIGAGLKMLGEGQSQKQAPLVVSFFILVVILLFLRRTFPKQHLDPSGGSRS